ncbi:hypothetical protein HG537_0D06570 [Torulaspora globosa]|uniref:Integrase catalytic domain-containing protein n=1 Tax=Torulaspora globosa TaxID=48254 RepID=A0A7H9HUB7_9SACH|nr:hypothetical protein HG537_0D06570 [Torulaspora sp. CBS 2947]
MEGKSSKNKHTMHSGPEYQNEYAPFEFIHVDLFGPISVPVADMARYMISFIDECTRYKWVFPLVEKDSRSITEKFQELVMFIKTQFDTKVLCFQMDQGSEFMNKKIKRFFCKNQIDSRYTTVDDSQSTERINRVLFNDCLTFLNSVNLPEDLWFYAVKFVTVIRNSLLSSIGDSPRIKAALIGSDASTLLRFGQKVIVNQPKTDSKLHAGGVVGYALCPSSTSFGYLIYVPESAERVIDTEYYEVIGANAPLKETIIDPLIKQAESRIGQRY